MKRAYLTGIRKIEIKEEEIPEPGPGEVLIRVRSALTCGTDLKTWKRGHPKMNFPMPFGHEYSGIVAKRGKGVKKFKEGDSVMGVNTAPCGRCHYCKIGKHNLCENLWENVLLGAYAEYILIPENIVNHNLYHKPPNIDFDEAAFLEPLSNIVHSYNLLEIKEGPVLIYGLGTMGFLCLSLLKSKGLEVIAVGRRENRLSLAKELGADSVIDTENENIEEKVKELTDGRGVPYVLECTGSSEVWVKALTLVDRGGTLLLFGGLPKGTNICYSAERIHYDELTLRGSFHFTLDDVKEAYNLIVGQKLPLRRLISGTFSLNRLEEAFLKLERREGIKYAIHP